MTVWILDSCEAALVVFPQNTAAPFSVSVSHTAAVTANPVIVIQLINEPSKTFCKGNGNGSIASATANVVLLG